MMTLCTYFDAAFLPRGLALYQSLARHWRDFTLIVLCLDDDTERVMRALGLPHVHVLPLQELEQRDPSLRAVRSTRSRVGYFMTCTPVLLRHALDRSDAAFYLDA